MTAMDFVSEGSEVTRMAVIKGVMSRFIDQRIGDRIGLIIFGGQAFVLSPLTPDRAAVRALLDEVVPRIAGAGTAIGDAIGVGVKKLRHRPAESRVLVLITDGEQQFGTIPLLEGAYLAAQEGVKIHAIGVGSHQKEVKWTDDSGRVVIANDLGFDEESLREVARVTGGAYFRATDTQALEQISARINELAKSEAETRTVLVPHPLYRWPLALALLALLGLGLLPGALQLPWGSRA
jgi:Ca-activated chloride channel family protein